MLTRGVPRRLDRQPGAPSVRAGIAALAGAFLLLAPLSSAFAYMAILRQSESAGGFIEVDDRHGSTVAAGDFNGDGFDDLAVGAPLEDLVIDGVVTLNTGVVTVNYGSPYGITHLNAEYRFASNSNGVSRADMHFGYALAAGDFDADGFDDLVVGAPGATIGGAAEAGEFFFMHGASTGLLNGFPLTQEASGDANEAGDRFGSAFAVGDFDGDGVDDLAVGGPGEDGGAGAVFFLLADPDGADLWGTTGWFKQSTLGFADLPDDAFGAVLTAANVFSTAEEDLVVGAPYRDLGIVPDAGSIYLIKGSPSGPTADGSQQYSAGTFGGTQEDGLFGFSLAAGTFMAAGSHVALAIGEPGRDLGGVIGAGRVIVVPGDDGSPDWGSRVQLDRGAFPVPERFGETLASGDWNAGTDASDDLAVGLPSWDNNALDDAGRIQLFFGRAAGPQLSNSIVFNQSDVSDDSDADDEFGRSLAFGFFDGYGRANLAIGAPGQDEGLDSLEETPLVQDAGCVFVLAPWRQVLNLVSRNAVMYTRGDSLIYAQRPFDRVRPASTTKVMTAELALEANLGAVYTVPPWIESDVGGSKPFDLEPGEEVGLPVLLYAMMMVSDNGAAYGIADVVSYDGGAAPLAVCDFVDAMNTRAGVLGMASTVFSNPPGRDDPTGDCGDHFSTAFDMAELAKTAVSDPAFRLISSTEKLFVARNLFRDDVSVTEIDTLFNSCLESVRDFVPETVLAKTGTTGGAGKCLLFAAGDTIFAVGGLYAMPDSYNDRCGTKTADLINLGLTLVGPELFDTLPGKIDGAAGGEWRSAHTPASLSGVDSNDDLILMLSNLKTLEDSLYGGATEIEVDSDTTSVTVCQQTGTNPAALDFELTRGSLLILAPGATAFYRAQAIGAHSGFRIWNTGRDAVTVDVELTHPVLHASFILAPGQNTLLPSYPGPWVNGFELTITNLGLAPAVLEVEELGYGYPLLTLLPGATNAYQVMFTHSPEVQPFGLHVATAGHDANPGNTVQVIVRGRGEATPVDAPNLGIDKEPRWRFRALPPQPNPFFAQTALRFALARDGQLSATVVDAAGRAVRRLDAGRVPRGEGSLQWDGKDERGRAVARGVYFIRFQLDGQPAGRARVIRVR